jgi:hypothetical protein
MAGMRDIGGDCTAVAQLGLLLLFAAFVLGMASALKIWLSVHKRLRPGPDGRQEDASRPLAGFPWLKKP